MLPKLFLVLYYYTSLVVPDIPEPGDADSKLAFDPGDAGLRLENVDFGMLSEGGLHTFTKRSLLVKHNQGHGWDRIRASNLQLRRGARRQ